PLANHAAVRKSGDPEWLARATLPGALGTDPAWRRAGNDRRCLGPGSREPHACRPAIRWLRGIYQTGVKGRRVLVLPRIACCHCVMSNCGMAQYSGIFGRIAAD